MAARASAPGWGIAFALLLALAAAWPAAAGAATQARAFTATADAHVTAARANGRYGGATELHAQASPQTRAYVRFSVQGLSGAVTRATLRLGARSSSSAGIAARAVNGSWAEGTITWRNSPGVGATPVGTSGAFLAGAPAEVDVTPLVAGDGAVNVAITTADAALVAFSSREGLAPPQLVVETSVPDATTDPDTTLTGGPSETHRSGVARFTFASPQPGASFECRLDGAPFAPCSSPHVEHVVNGAHTFEVRAVYAGRIDATAARREWRADALLQNGTFETPATGWVEQRQAMAGWVPYQAGVVVEPGGVAGRKARVTVANGAPFYSLYASPRTVNATTAGRVYTATGYVRSSTPGKQVCLELVERSATAQVGATAACVTATTGWQPFPAVRRAAAGEGNELYPVVSQDGAVNGESFEVDGLELDDGTPLTVAQPTATPPGDPVLLAVADVASCWSSGDEAVARLVDTQPGIVAIAGDTEQNNATAAEFAGCYEPTWGRHRWRTRPAVGDHEYRQPGAGPYWDYFGAAAGERGKGWYSYDVGAWHVVVLNSNCAAVGGCGPGSEQYEWLKSDLAANGRTCTGAYFHHPLFSAGSLHGGKDFVRPFWDLLYEHGAEFVYGGNDHTYQRFAPQTPDGALDRSRGIRQFVVGTGGTQLYPLGPPLANTEVQHNATFGVLRLTLKPSSYAWKFLPQSGRSFTDEGETACSGDTAPPAQDTTPPSVALTAPADGATVSGTAVRIAADASDAGGVARVELLAGGTVVASDTTAPYEASWDSTRATDGPVTIVARAVDAAGNATTASRAVTVVNAAPPPPPPATSLLANGSFEVDLAGWNPYNAAAARVSGGADGAWSARVTYGSGSSFSLIATPVTSTPAGVTYSARAWLRSPGGRRVCLRIRERVSGASYGPSACLTGSSAWQQTPALSYVARGGGMLDVYAYQDTAPVRGDAFDVDGVTLTAG